MFRPVNRIQGIILLEVQKIGVFFYDLIGCALGESNSIVVDIRFFQGGRKISKGATSARNTERKAFPILYALHNSISHLY